MNSTTNYTYATDAETGTIQAANWDEAKRKLMAMMTPAMLADGAWGWVEDTDGERFQHGDADHYEPTHYGDLHDYTTGDYIRLATFAEAQASAAAGPEGVIVVGGRSCYVDA